MQTPQQLRQHYQYVRQVSEQICAPLVTEDYQIQSIEETSPPKWHLAHVTWFFETFLLKLHSKDYQPFHPQFEILFNSYYETVGKLHPRPKRGLLARPTVKEVYAYRHTVDKAMDVLFDMLEQYPDDKIQSFIELGLNHEQQHQELMCMDIKHNFSVNPLKPAYRSDLPTSPVGNTFAVQWHEQTAGVYEVGHDGNGFAYDNEAPRHPQYVPEFKLANRLVTNGEYLAFIEDGGYQQVDLWLSDGWHHINQYGWQYPLYWQRDGQFWQEMTLGGLRLLNPHEPVSHVSYYEADAYARWAGKRLPTEAEVEIVLAGKPLQGNFFDQEHLHPQPATVDGQWFGDLWAWTATDYHPYPGFKPLEGSAGEYNGKFMCNQKVLRGGCCATSLDHMRVTYRNFFYPHERWAFTGIRMADNASK
ncbi:ergothioneine biosynthesis protein EgtB [Thiothrix litoralis]|uniref:Ergothioneine biosynthesis protein EgtB n=1 Tax=Thiothrix litoralis TaxID=2891210 RepID=A0ABX7WQR1_9GAMM|nr:ergothioneine biosynthesis protein EgtB [Thiothrix litoralis]QTR45451.1 ergothioneine biosynthesis protein EgtB [Thiothrix litoralis]